MIYREQSDDINVTRPSMDVTRPAKVPFRDVTLDATDLQYQILLIKVVAT